MKTSHLLLAAGAAAGLYAAYRWAHHARPIGQAPERPDPEPRPVLPWIETTSVPAGARFRMSVAREGTAAASRLTMTRNLESIGDKNVFVWVEAWPSDWPTDDRGPGRNRSDAVNATGFVIDTSSADRSKVRMWLAPGAPEVTATARTRLHPGTPQMIAVLGGT